MASRQSATIYHLSTAGDNVRIEAADHRYGNVFGRAMQVINILVVVQLVRDCWLYWYLSGRSFRTCAGGQKVP